MASRPACPRSGTTTYKVILTGDIGVGKSSIFVRYRDGTFVESMEGTIGLDQLTKTLMIGNQNFKVFMKICYYFVNFGGWLSCNLIV